MSDRDARVEAALDAYWQARDGGQDNVESMRVALVAADAVQGDVTNSPALTEAYLKGLAAGRSEPADDRRMVDLDAVLSWLRETAHLSWSQATPVLNEAADRIEREFGGPAPSERLPTPDDVHGILAGYQTEDEVVANRRMVDLDAAAGWIADNVPGVGYAQKFRIEFAASAPGKDQP